MDDMISSPLTKALIWLVPVIFGAGGVYASLQRAGADVERIEKVSKANEKLVQTHTAAAFGHEGAKERIKKIETNQQQIITRQQRAGENIAAICEATKANCR